MTSPQTEAAIEQRLKAGIEARGGLCLKLNPTAYRGIPDRMVLLPGGELIFIELKKPSGRLSRLQGHWRVMLERLGFEVLTLWSDVDVDQFLRELG